jgi:hypothetical protein
MKIASDKRARDLPLDTYVTPCAIFQNGPFRLLQAPHLFMYEIVSHEKFS